MSNEASVPLCPHVIGYFRNDIPPEEHQILTGECGECGPVSATAPSPRTERTGFSSPAVAAAFGRVLEQHAGALETLKDL